MTEKDLQCPKCGSKNKLIHISESCDMYDFVTAFLKRDKRIYDGDHRFYEETRRKIGFDWDTQQPCIVYRKYDRTSDGIKSDRSYIERILTLKGELIKDKKAKECLLDHQGHGNAKDKGNRKRK